MADRRPIAVEIGEISRSDHDEWQRLWAGYLRFYRQRLAPEITGATFERLLDPNRDPRGLVARHADGRLSMDHLDRAVR